jgi:UDP-N-acetylmuramoyl-L-alanyl-D-glutamate--2,6-diaminopimelate ligase
MKMLKNILNGVDVIRFIGDDKSICGLSTDSRTVEKGYVFIAVKGTQQDGHTYIASVIENGVEVIVCENLPETLHDSVTYIKVKNTLKDLGIIAANFYDNPSAKLILTGVTGTNGKTTTATLLYEMFKQGGYKVGLLSTVINYIDDKPIEATHTTPDSIQLNYLLAEMVNAGCTHCFMEVSSHAIEQKRINGLQFNVGIFTNLTHDHLDYHKTFSNYLQAKKMFFDALSSNAVAIVNTDDKNGLVMVQNSNAKKITYALKSMADYNCKIIEQHLHGMELKLNGTSLWVQFIGDFNAYNLLAVYVCAIKLGLNKDKVLQLMSMLKPVNGRFEYIQSVDGKTVIVDYAHTPDALVNVLDTIKNLLNNIGGNVITVVGAGGNRDKLKRPVMAKIAAEKSDKVILTSDNPRFEKPEDILNDMLVGVTKELSGKVLTITDRREAIKTAVMLAQKGDIVLIAGKGHENYQDVNGVKHHFDDKEEVKNIFNLK